MQRKDGEKTYFRMFVNRAENSNHEDKVDNVLDAIDKVDLRAVKGAVETYSPKIVTTNSKTFATTPIHKAILNLANKNGDDYQKRLAIVRFLLKETNIDINAIADSTEPVIFMATSINNTDVLAMILEDENLEINKQDNVGYTALHDAAERGHLECVKLLLDDKRIDTSVLNNDNKTADEVINRFKDGLNTQAIKQLFEDHRQEPDRGLKN